MTTLAFGAAIRSAQNADPSAVPAVLSKVAADLGATDLVAYLVDFAQTTLEPLPDHRAHAEKPSSEEVATTLAGRAFLGQEPTTAERPEGARVWVPIVEGSDRTGVLALTVPSTDGETLRACEDLGLFAGYLIATHARATDLYNLHRRRRSLSLAASMQWDLLPPLVLKTERVAVAGLLEPAYEVGGDCFDYALNGSMFDLGVFDPVGHGVGSALIAALCVGSYRHDRREDQTLEQIHAHLDAAVAERLHGSFSTGQLARLDVDSGEMTWTNAGHPLPLLIRGGKVIRELDCPAGTPWGLGPVLRATSPPVVASEALEPGDSVLFFTDGVTEAHLPGGEEFGVDRLTDLAGQHSSAGLPPEEMVRRLVRAVLEHQDDSLRDDATLVVFQWLGPRS